MKRMERRRHPVHDLMRESHVLRQALDYLGYEDILALRLNSGEAERQGRRIMLCPEGTADIMAEIPRGRSFRKWDDAVPSRNERHAIVLWIETKHPRTGRLRMAQKLFRDRVLADGAVYLEMRGLEDLKAILPPKIAERNAR